MYNVQGGFRIKGNSVSPPLYPYMIASLIDVVDISLLHTVLVYSLLILIEVLSQDIVVISSLPSYWHRLQSPFDVLAVALKPSR